MRTTLVLNGLIQAQGHYWLQCKKEHPMTDCAKLYTKIWSKYKSDCKDLFRKAIKAATQIINIMTVFIQ